MTRIKLCGLSRLCDIEAANELEPEYIGFVFAPKSRRYITPAKAAILKQALDSKITAVGIFEDEAAGAVAELLNLGTIGIAQLHGREDKDYVGQLRMLTDKPVIKAFRIETASDAQEAHKSNSDYILLDSGAGSGAVFDWKLIQNVKRPYFLAGGLSPDNVRDAVRTLRPFAVDISSGIETNGLKDKCKMADFVAAVRKEG